jgi:hypothetical protein
MRGYNLTLAANASADGAAVQWTGGHGFFTAEATFGGGTVKLQFKTLNGTWIDVPGASLTAAGAKEFYAPAGELRASIATATGVYAYVHPINLM